MLITFRQYVGGTAGPSRSERDAVSDMKTGPSNISVERFTYGSVGCGR